MKKNLLFGMITLLAGPLMAADASPKDDVQSAATALGNAANYTWQSTVDMGANSQFQPGPTDGKTEKGGYTTLSTSFNDNTSEGVLKGTNGAVKSDSGWQSLADATSAAAGGGGFNPSTMIVRQLQNLKTPAVEVTNLLAQAKELKKDADAISGDLTEDGAKALLSTTGGRGGATPPTITNPKGSVKFWVTDGKLVKYQVHITGTVSRNGNDRDVDRTTTTVIKEVGTTKIAVADEVKKILP
jgi:hypothetical protein